jgi:hypothetical protein
MTTMVLTTDDKVVREELFDSTNVNDELKGWR